jgi:hypothetical protein
LMCFFPIKKSWVCSHSEIALFWFDCCAEKLKQKVAEIKSGIVGAESLANRSSLFSFVNLC